MIGPDKLPVAGALDQSGNYSIDEVVVGEVQVGVISPDPGVAAKKAQAMSWIGKSKAKGKAGAKDNTHDMPPSQGAADSVIAKKRWVKLPRNIEFPDRSGITTIIQPGKNTFNIELK
jgi:hypothetical protein